MSNTAGSTEGEAELDQDLSPAELIEKRGVVKRVPHLAEQLEDESRTNIFKYVPVSGALWNASPIEGAPQVSMTEQEGLKALHEFLVGFSDAESGRGRGDTRLALKARGMAEKLTFIGEKEHKEGVAGFGEYWKAYLDEDPDRQICVPSLISDKYDKRKSDIHLFEAILSGFSDEELEHYSGRIVAEIGELTADPEDAKIILLDDWTVSGSQLIGAYTTAGEISEKYKDSREINVIVASKDRIEKGLLIDPVMPGQPEGPRIPLKAYFESEYAPETSEMDHKGHVTGTHSSVDFDFESDIGQMVEHARSVAQGKREPVRDIVMPPLTNIVRPYRDAEPILLVLPDGKIVRNKV